MVLKQLENSTSQGRIRRKAFVKEKLLLRKKKKMHIVHYTEQREKVAW
jgi:hypothetical protein